MDEKLTLPKAEAVPDEVLMRDQEFQLEKEKLAQLERDSQEKLARLNPVATEEILPPNLAEVVQPDRSSGDSKALLTMNEELKRQIEESRKAIEQLNVENQQLRFSLDASNLSLDKRNQELNKVRRDTEDKSSQITNLQILVKQLTDLTTGTGNNNDIDSWKKCDMYQLNCTNLPALRRRFDNIQDEFVESFNHELEEIRYLFADELRRIETFLSPFTTSATLIKFVLPSFSFLSPSPLSLTHCFLSLLTATTSNTSNIPSLSISTY